MGDVRWLHPGDRLLSTDPMEWSFRDLCQAAAMLDTDDRMVEHLADHAVRPEVRQRLRVLLRLIDDEGETAPFSAIARQRLSTMIGP
ncbi:hypothetical protein [Raineyella fluvialis]|uniref:Uncharacterized protein n=1 Tax=Raineyella fluvialis TaxID=2662261 RepID=A0A5Q2FD73_9ACTN|nr:hypothetical protein [Raineyella fluvialis]QGF24892.1 hypothetical protein Rai3103_16130 [Raineyella fluvialis]